MSETNGTVGAWDMQSSVPAPCGVKSALARRQRKSYRRRAGWTAGTAPTWPFSSISTSPMSISGVVACCIPGMSWRAKGPAGVGLLPPVATLRRGGAPLLTGSLAGARGRLCATTAFRCTADIAGDAPLADESARLRPPPLRGVGLAGRVALVRSGVRLSADEGVERASTLSAKPTARRPMRFPRKKLSSASKPAK